MWKYLLSAAMLLGSICNALTESHVITADYLETELLSFGSNSLKQRVWFVNNTNPQAGEGSYANPFNTLVAAQNASREYDIIFVYPGDNTTAGMNQGFVMKKGQRLLGAGVDHDFFLNGKKFTVAAATTTLPSITNAVGGNGITLANSTHVEGIHLVNINAGTPILGGDNNPLAPLTPAIGLISCST